eukprot:9307131-Pyramimonas_sp.AAC.1
MSTAAGGCTEAEKDLFTDGRFLPNVGSKESRRSSFWKPCRSSCTYASPRLSGTSATLALAYIR